MENQRDLYKKKLTKIFKFEQDQLVTVTIALFQQF